MPGRTLLVSPTVVRTIIERFEMIYPRMGSPRILIYVNRELVDDLAGMKFFPGKDKSAPATNKSALILDADPKPNAAPPDDADSEPSQFPGSQLNQYEALARAAERRYRLRDRDIPTLLDKQTGPELERVFGRPLRTAHARMSDSSTASALIGDLNIKSFTSPAEDEATRKNREALKKIADVVVEIQIAPHNVPLPGTTEAKTYVVPDLQATAIRLSDSKVIGQVASSDILGRVYSYANRIIEMPEITEVTALALMEDMMMNAR